MKSNLIILSFLFLSSFAFSQSMYYKSYDWKETPDKVVVTDEEKEKDEILLFQKISREYYMENEEVSELFLFHTITLINTDAGIEANNKMYINNPQGTTVITQKARVIKPDGKIIELKESDIQESKNDDGEVEYRYFALEGLEKGCVIEYIHYRKEFPEYTGRLLLIQNEIKKKRIEVDIIAPKHLDFLIHCMNGLPDFTLDTTAFFVRRKFLEIDNLEALEGEAQAPYQTLIKKCYFKLNKNLNSGNGNFYIFTEAAKNIHSNMYGVTPKKALKKLKAIVKDVTANGGASKEEQIRYLENKLKSEYSILDFNAGDLSNLEYILTKKICSETGMTKLFIHTLRLMNIKHELVLSSDRESNPILPDYEAYNFLDEYLVYVQEIDKYWSANVMTRLGFVPYELTQTKGLFIEDRNLNGMFICVSKLKDIKGTKAEESVDKIDAVINFSDDIMNPNVTIERTLSGYKASFPQFILDLVDDEKKKEFKEDVLKYIDKEAKLENITYKNDNSKVGGTLPFSAKAAFDGTSFTESAGDKTLFKVGLVIGPQAEMYDEKERKLPVMTEYTRKYVRTIEVTIPENMIIKNLDALKMNVITSDKTTGFVSNYVLTGNKLMITVEEYYQKTNYTVAEYKEYQAVMNAAADFNKLTLVLEKK